MHENGAYSMNNENDQMSWLRSKFNLRTRDVIDEGSADDSKSNTADLEEVQRRQRYVAARLRALRLEADVIARQRSGR